MAYEESVSPFENQAAHGQAQQQYAGGSFFNPDLSRRERELDAKEAELRRREQDLKRREDAAEEAGIVIEERIWSPFFPLIPYDIAREIPAHQQRIQYFLLASWLGFVILLVLNFIAVTTHWVDLKKSNGVKIWLLAIIYAISGIPGAYVLWYKPLYQAVRNENVLKLGWCLFLCLLHLLCTIFVAAAAPVVFKGDSLVDIISAVTLFSSSTIAGILYIVGFSRSAWRQCLACGFSSKCTSAVLACHSEEKRSCKWNC